MLSVLADIAVRVRSGRSVVEEDEDLIAITLRPWHGVGVYSSAISENALTEEDCSVVPRLLRLSTSHSA